MNIREFHDSMEDYQAVLHILNTVWSGNSLTLEDLQQADKQRKSEVVHGRFLMEDDTGVTAYGSFERRGKIYPPDCFVMHLDVLPAYRQQGIGGKLYDYMLSIMTDNYNVSEVHASTADHYDSSIHFLTHRGFREVKRQWETHLDTLDFDGTAFQDIENQVALQGIKVQALDVLLAGDKDALHKVYELYQQLVQDVPSPVQRSKVDYESWRMGYSEENPKFLPKANFIALHHTEYIGLSSLWGEPSSGKLYTGLTAIQDKYRQKGIATALKLRGIILAQALGHPLIITFNHSKPMLLLNQKLGFYHHATKIMFVKKIKSST